ncbi:MAG: alpha/beta fold hydrolase [Patescibacteria group bacterium]
MLYLRSKNKKVLFKTSLALLGIGLGFGIFFLINDKPLISNPIKNISQSLNPAEKVVDEPFKEMTIPYVKNRSYESELGDLEQTSQNSNFTSYLTNYDSDGLRVNGLLTIPEGEQPLNGWPAIIFIHGYIAPSTYLTLTRYVDHVNFLARNGFVVFKIDLRGHGNSEGEPGGAYYSEDYIIDALNARAALQSADFVNPDGIGFWGHSMAGNVILRSIAARPDIPAAVIWAGAVYTYEDFQEYRLNDNSYRPPSMSTRRSARRQQLFDTHGEFDSSSSFWSKVPATNFLDGVETAIQLHHASDDNVVNIRYSSNLNDILDNTSISHEFYEYSSGGHNITGSSFNSAMQRTVDFFKKNL